MRLTLGPWGGPEATAGRAVSSCQRDYGLRVCFLFLFGKGCDLIQVHTPSLCPGGPISAATTTSTVAGEWSESRPGCAPDSEDSPARRRPEGLWPGRACPGQCPGHWHSGWQPRRRRRDSVHHDVLRLVTFVVLGLGRHGATVSVEPPTVGRVHRTRRRVKSLRTNCTSELTKEVSRFSDSESETVSRICRLLRPQAAGWILALEVADVTYYSRIELEDCNLDCNLDDPPHKQNTAALGTRTTEGAFDAPIAAVHSAEESSLLLYRARNLALTWHCALESLFAGEHTYRVAACWGSTARHSSLETLFRSNGL
eukprot:3585865-Rhodomonas_salina.1